MLSATQPPDIIFLQEVTPEVRTTLLSNPRIQDSFFATDAEDTTAFDQVPFATMALLSRARFAASEWTEKGEGEAGKLAIGRVSRISLPSMYKRDALCLEVVSPDAAAGTIVSLVNVHLDSLWRHDAEVETLLQYPRRYGESSPFSKASRQFW
jgi:tyrosyl-DNA phosphodiesterase 2